MSQEERINYLKYTFFKIDKSWYHQDIRVRQEAKDEFVSLVKEFSQKLKIALFSLIGTRADTTFLIVSGSKRLEDFEEMMSRILHSSLGSYLEIPYSYIAIERKSHYFTKPKIEEISGPFSDKKYMFVYPFVKKREWYRLPFSERQKMMGEHFRIGSKYRGIRINTGYSFGLDDQEFVLAFEGDDPYEFLRLVEELRSSDASQYTHIEIPIFTCIRTTPERLMDLI
jgi:chlorite dismutase